MTQGCIQIICYDDPAVDCYRIVYPKDNAHNLIEVPLKSRIAESYSVMDIESAQKLINQLISKFMLNDDTFLLNINWLKLVCKKVQREVNNDSSIMDLDLPFL